MEHKIKELENILNTTFYPGDIDEVNYFFKKFKEEILNETSTKVYKLKLYFPETNGYTFKYVNTKDEKLINEFLLKEYPNKKVEVQKTHIMKDYIKLV